MDHLFSVSETEEGFAMGGQSESSFWRSSSSTPKAISTDSICGNAFPKSTREAHKQPADVSDG
jgi:hypothetical protein